MPPTALRAPAAHHHYDLAESGLADLGRVGFDDAGRTVEVLVALTDATLAIAATFTTKPERIQPQGPTLGRHEGRPAGRDSAGPLNALWSRR